MHEVEFFNEEYQCGFRLPLPREARVTFLIGGASFDFAIKVRGTERFATVGFPPAKVNEFVEALRSRDAIKLTGETPGGGLCWGTWITVTPKTNGKVELRAAETGNPAATVTLTPEAVTALVDALDASEAIVPKDVDKLRGYMEECEPRFWNENPGVREQLDAMLADKRYTMAQTTFHNTHNSWFKRVREPEIMAKPMTPARLAAIDAVLAALRAP